MTATDRSMRRGRSSHRTSEANCFVTEYTPMSVTEESETIRAIRDALAEVTRMPAGNTDID
jgi:hypothetical protein